MKIDIIEPNVPRAKLTNANIEVKSLHLVLGIKRITAKSKRQITVICIFRFLDIIPRLKYLQVFWSKMNRPYPSRLPSIFVFL